MDYTKLIVDRIESQNETVGSFLRKNGVSARLLSSLRKKLGLIKKNNEISTTNLPIKIGDEIEISNNIGTPSCICSCITPLNVVYEDDQLLVVEKPANLSSMPSRSHFDHNLSGIICSYMKEKNPSFVLRMINRLDKDASGLILVAKTPYAASFFFETKDSIDKTYFAFASGIIKDDIKIEKPILTVVDENNINDRKRIVSDKGESAKTFLHPLSVHGQNTFVSVKIQHGRTHQIRVHLASVSHPLIGDELYGCRSEKIDRTALHLGEMTVTHPVTKEKIKFISHLPKDIETLILCGN